MILRGIDRTEEGSSTLMLAREKWQIKTVQVLEMAFEERTRQVAQYGHNEDLEPGFGPNVDWLPINLTITMALADEIEEECRRDYEKHEARHGKPTWMHLIREELAEAFAEEPGSPEAIAEMVQVMALLSSYIEKHI